MHNSRNNNVGVCRNAQQGSLDLQRNEAQQFMLKANHGHCHDFELNTGIPSCILFA